MCYNLIMNILNRNIYKLMFIKCIMVRLREIIKYGNTYCIRLKSIDLKDLKLNVGDEIDIEDAIVKKRRNKK